MDDRYRPSWRDRTRLTGRLVDVSCRAHAPMRGSRPVAGCAPPRSPSCLDPSAVEDEPADVVAQALVVEHERADRVRKLRALPAALANAGLVRLIAHDR